MAVKSIPTPEKLRQLLHYDAETGKLFWRPRLRDSFPNDRMANTWNSRFQGKEAGASHSHGYLIVRVTLDGKTHTLYAHRIIWAMIYDAWPALHIDHINGNPADNRISNIREASRSENMHNRRGRHNGSSIFKGVHRLHDGGWCASLRVSNPSRSGRGKSIYIGYFRDEAAAARAYNEAAIRHHGEFARLNAVWPEPPGQDKPGTAGGIPVKHHALDD